MDCQVKLTHFGGVIAAKYGCNSLIVKVIGMTSKITGALSISMITFDIAALIAPENNPISQLNSKANNNDVYKFFKNATLILATLTGGMSKGISNSQKCFIAGTLILTAEGLKNIEDIKPGDLVLSTETDTMERGYKPVVETYIRKTKELIHFIIGGKEVVTTPEHPFYVVGAGFVAAALLCIGTPLVDVEGKELQVEQIYREDLGQEEVSVYNFQVEDWHTYHVSDVGVLVHNAGRGYGEEGKGASESGSRSYSLLPGEGDIGTYRDLLDAGEIGDNITPHHMPSAEYMSQYRVGKKDGLCMNMEMPSPGTERRKKIKDTKGRNMTDAEKAYYYSLSPRAALAYDIANMREIYQSQGLYSEIRPKLQEYIKQYKELMPELFDK